MRARSPSSPDLLDLLSDIVWIGLIALAVAPLAFVGILALATWLDWPIAGPILEGTVRLMALQFRMGALLNILLGLALIGLGLWLAPHSARAWQGPVAAVTIALGLWRIARGLSAWRDAGR